MREMKWHIYGLDHQPLCWDGQALEFNTENEAQRFLESCFEHGNKDDEFWEDICIIEDILFYDGGYLNASEKIVDYDEKECEEILIDAE